MIVTKVLGPITQLRQTKVIIAVNLHCYILVTSMMLYQLGSQQNLYDICIFHRIPKVIEENNEDSCTYHSPSTTLTPDRFHFVPHYFTIVKDLSLPGE